MIDKERIKKLNQSLKKGDKKAIAELSGISQFTVNRFFNSDDVPVSDEISSLIISNAAKIIKKRNELKKASEKLLDSI